MLQKPCICIVDDHESVRESLSDSLSVSHYDILTFSSGTDLLAYEGNPMPDVILLDVMMPDMDGFAVCTRLKESERWRHIPVILITALNTRDYMVRGLESGAEEYLVKPVNSVELRARVRSMLRIKQQYDELQATLKMREKLANMIVHDMRQPINVALLQHSLINLRHHLTADDEHSLNVIQNNLRRLDALVNDILVAAKVQNDCLLLERSPVSVKTLLEKMRDDYVLQAQAASTKLYIDLPSQDRICYLDENLIIRLIDNLVTNAIKFSPQDGQIVLRLAYPPEDQGQLCLQVIDEGPGVPPDYAQDIFDEFRIIPMREKNGPQVGLGLAFCKMVVDAHNGRICVTPNKPTGSIFTVHL